MAVNFPDTSANNPNTGVAWADGDQTQITADGVTITYEFKTQDDDHWWKSMGILESPQVSDRIVDGNSRVLVNDTGASAAIEFNINGTNVGLFRNDEHFVVGGANLETDPGVDISDAGRIDINRESDAGFFAQWSDTNNVRFQVAADGVVVLKDASDANEVVLSTTGNNRINNTVKIGNNVAVNDANQGNVELRANGDIVAQGNIISGTDVGDYVSTKELRSRDNSNESTIIFSTRNALGAPTTQAGLRSGGNPAYCIGGTLSGAGNTWTPNITLNTNGTSTFLGNIQVGTWNGSTGTGTTVGAGGTLAIRPATATGNNVFSVIPTSTGTLSTVIRDDGTADFIGSLRCLNTTNSTYSRLYPQGFFISRFTTGNINSRIYGWSIEDQAGSERFCVRTDGTVDIGGTLTNAWSTSTPAIRLEPLNNGRITFASGGGINFHNYGTGVTVDSNLLDDYEEGTWTPAVNCITTPPTVAYNSLQGSYTKVGDKVTVWGYINVNTISGGAGDYIISGLPFTASNTAKKNLSGGQAPMNIGRMSNMNTSCSAAGERLDILGETANANDWIYLYVLVRDASNDMARSSLNDWNNSSVIRFCCTYSVD